MTSYIYYLKLNLFVALMYSLFGVGLQLVRGQDDEFNTLTAATATGLLYKASGRVFIFIIPLVKLGYKMKFDIFFYQVAVLLYLTY